MNYKKILLFTLVLVSISVLAGCKNNNGKRLETGINDEYTLYLQTSRLEGVFNPFFNPASDQDVIDLVNAPLLTLDSKGNVVAGDDYPTVALDYSMWYTRDPGTNIVKDKYQQGDYVVYEFILKSGMKFSDGTAITAEDVLFNYYLYLDVAYDGPSLLNTLPILGLKEYQTQTNETDTSEYNDIIDAILADDTRNSGYAANDLYTKEQHDLYWESFYEAGSQFALEIVDYICEWAAGYEDMLHPDLTTEEVQGSEQLRVAYAMMLWQCAMPLSEDKLTIDFVSGATYHVSDLTGEVFFREILKAYEDESGKVDIEEGYQGISEIESVGSNFVSLAREIFIDKISKAIEVQSIAGLVAGKKQIRGVQYDTIRVILTKIHPGTLQLLNIPVAPKHHYIKGFAYDSEATINYGVQYGSTNFIEHVRSNNNPLGAGPYKLIRRDSIDGTVYFERNNYFQTMGGEKIFNAYIKNVALRVISPGSEMAALKSGYVHFAKVNHSKEVLEELDEQAKLHELIVNHLGYNYISINPKVYPNLHERIALTTVLDPNRIFDILSTDLAELIWRSQSKVSWTYPDLDSEIYSFDETLTTTIEEFKQAGYQFCDESGQFVDFPKEYEFFVPYDASEHPLGIVMLNAAELLSSIGIPAKVTVDKNLSENIKSSNIGIYASAKDVSVEPDLYNDYHFESVIGLAIQNGIADLYQKGSDSSLGLIDGMNQRLALAYLAELIDSARSSAITEERKQIYEDALELIAKLAIEVSLYQGKDLFIVNGSIVDRHSLARGISEYKDPLSEIWKVRFLYGTPGNQTI